MEDDTKNTQAGEAGSELRKCSDEVAQEKEVWNRHKDEEKNAQENANMDELLASDASVHVMNHVEWAISGATMEMAGQWRDSLWRKRGREE